MNFQKICMKRFIVPFILLIFLLSIFVSATFSDRVSGFFTLPRSSATQNPTQNPTLNPTPRTTSMAPVCQFYGNEFNPNPSARPITFMNACLSFGNNYVPVAEVVINRKTLFVGRTCAEGTSISPFDDNNDGAGSRNYWGDPMKNAIIGQVYTASTSCLETSSLANFSIRRSMINDGVWCCKKE